MIKIFLKIIDIVYLKHLSKNSKLTIIHYLFRSFRIDPLIFAYNSIGILKWENEIVSGEKYFINHILPIYLGNKKELVVFDVGSNIGNYTGFLIQNFPTARVHAFEPVSNSFNQIKKRFAIYENIIVNNIALGSNDKVGMIHTYGNDLGSEHASLYEDVISDIHKSQDVVGLEIKIEAIDSYCKKLKIENIDFLKIDTEGTEYDVLIGAKTMLLENRISIIQFEFNEMNVISRTMFKDFYNLLSNKYYLFRLNSYNLIPIEQYDSFLEIYKFQNIIAISKEIYV